MATGQQHEWQKKIISCAFTPQKLREYSEIMNKHAEILVKVSTCTKNNRKAPIFYLCSWWGASHCEKYRIPRNYAETVSTKFPHQEIRSNYGIFHSLHLFFLPISLPSMYNVNKCISLTIKVLPTPAA